jgi:hypothetical protein
MPDTTWPVNGHLLVAAAVDAVMENPKTRARQK